MGLDAVELIMECERAFGISIPDEDASKIVTVGDLYGIILKLTADRVEGPTRTSTSAFYRLRQGLVACGLDRDHILPTSRLKDLLPAEQRKVLWTQLAKATGIRLPKLVRPAWVDYVMLACAGVAGIAAWAYMRRVSLGLVAALSTLVLVRALTYSLCTDFPSACNTVEDLVYAVIGRKENAIVPPRQLGPRETWNVLRNIIADQLGVREDDIKPDTRFVQDLGVD